MCRHKSSVRRGTMYRYARSMVCCKAYYEEGGQGARRFLIDPTLRASGARQAASSPGLVCPYRRAGSFARRITGETYSSALVGTEVASGTANECGLRFGRPVLTRDDRRGRVRPLATAPLANCG